MNVSNLTEQDNNFAHKHELKLVMICRNLCKIFLHFLILTTMPSLQGFVGIVGNILTLISIGKLKSRTNVHILMIYLALADIISFHLSITFLLVKQVFLSHLTAQHCVL